MKITRPEDQEFIQLLKENLENTKKTLELTKKIRRYIFIGQIVGFVKVLIILVPIILGIIYLPPLLKEFFSIYQSLLGLGEPDSLGQFLEISQKAKDWQELLK